MAAKDAFEARLAELEAAKVVEDARRLELAKAQAEREATAAASFDQVLEFLRKSDWIKGRNFEVNADHITKMATITHRRGRVIVRAVHDRIEAAYSYRTQNGWNPAGQASGASFAEIEDQVGRMLANALTGEA